MERQTELALIRELISLHEQKSPYLDEHWERPTTERYKSQAIFDREREQIARKLPQIAALSSQLAEPGSYLSMELAGLPLLLVRDESGEARAFYNVCRHRGAQLVTERQGCKNRLRCPYHAWTWNTSGELIGVPHEKTGFPGLDRGEFGLHTVACEEYAGWIWVCLDESAEIDVASHLGELAPDMLAMNAGDNVIFDTKEREVTANWKILVEGGIESYHFRVAHSNTIAPLFLDNLSSYRCFGRHIRSVLPRSTLPGLAEQAEETWSIAKHANVLYSLFPGSQFLVQEDHFVWIQGIPLAPDRTLLRLSTVIPAELNTEEMAGYWRRNHDLTMVTLDEDFDIGESIQHGINGGINEHLNFGRFEGALARFTDFVDEAIDA